MTPFNFSRPGVSDLESKVSRLQTSIEELKKASNEQAKELRELRKSVEDLRKSDPGKDKGRFPAWKRKPQRVLSCRG